MLDVHGRDARVRAVRRGGFQPACVFPAGRHGEMHAERPVPAGRPGCPPMDSVWLVQKFAGRRELQEETAGSRRGGGQMAEGTGGEEGARREKDGRQCRQGLTVVQ